MSYLNRIAGNISGFTCAGLAATYTAPGVGYISTRLLGRYIGTTAAAALGIPAAGVVAPLVIGGALHYGKQLPNAALKTAFVAQQTYRKQGHKTASLTPSFVNTQRHGRTVTRQQAIRTSTVRIKDSDLGTDSDWELSNLV